MNGNANERKAAIVTGASSGMGLGITQALVERGYGVVANSRTITKSKALKSFVNLVLVEGDIGQKETAIKVADAALKHFGRIDLLVNCAGIYMPKPFTEYAPEDFNAMISTNVARYFFITQQAVAQMRKQKSGYIVSISTALKVMAGNIEAQMNSFNRQAPGASAAHCPASGVGLKPKIKRSARKPPEFAGGAHNGSR